MGAGFVSGRFGLDCALCKTRVSTGIAVERQMSDGYRKGVDRVSVNGGKREVWEKARQLPILLVFEAPDTVARSLVLLLIKIKPFRLETALPSGHTSDNRNPCPTGGLWRTLV